MLAVVIFMAIGGMSKENQSLAGDSQQKAQKTAELGLTEAMMKSTGQTQQYVQDNYITPPVEQATQNLEEDLNELNPRIENEEFVPQLLSLFETARTKTEEAARQTRETLGSGIHLLKATTEAALSPKWQEQVEETVSLFEQQNEEPENREFAEMARLRSDTISENQMLFLELRSAGISEDRIGEFMDLRAETESRIIDEGIDAGLSMDEIEKQQRDARHKEAKAFLIKMQKEGQKPNETLMEQFNIFIDIADHRSELHDAGAYIEASNAETYSAYTTIMNNAKLDFLITEQSITMDMLEEDGDAVEVSPESFLWERDILDLWLDEQQQEEDIEEMLEELKEWEEDARETSGDNLFAADLPESLKESIEKELGEEINTGMPINDVKNKLQEDPEVYTAMLKTSPLEVPPGEGNWVGPFFSDPLEVIRDNGAEGVRITPQVLKARVSANFIDTAAEATRGEVTFSAPEEGEAQTPESAVAAYLEDPQNEEKKKAAFEVLKDPGNRRLRAAYFEAIARTANELRLERST